MQQFFLAIDREFIRRMRQWGIPGLRVALGIVFLWFGALKVFGVSPVASLLKETYSLLPEPGFTVALGLWEMAIGAGLLFRVALRATLFLLWLQMAGTFFSLFLVPSIFFAGKNIFLLTLEGEFVMKNIILIAAGIVVGGHEVKLREEVSHEKE